MKRKGEISFEVYWVVFSILNYLDNIFEECEISPEQLLVLTYIKYRGKDYGRGKLILRQEITKILKAIYRRQDAAISKIINDMLVRRLLGETTLSSDEKKQLFGTISGRKKALVLLTSGIKKTERVDDKINSLITQLTSDLSEFEYEQIKRVLSLSDDGALLASLRDKI